MKQDSWTRDKNGKQFATGVTCFDWHAKEEVVISNGKCILDHSSSDAYAVTHADSGCIYEPSEAVALRVSVDHKHFDHETHVAVSWTYRAVTAEDLTVVEKERCNNSILNKTTQQYSELEVAGKKLRKKPYANRIHFAGRV
jgi:hypothetical protein